MSLRASEIAAVVAELKPILGSRVDAVRVHSRRALSLDLFGRGGNVTLLVSAEPDVARLHVVAQRPAAPAPPLALQAVLRRDLDGATLADIAARSGDRVVELAFERGGTRRRLVAELTGRHGGLFLLDDQGRVLAIADRPSSPRRELVPGTCYTPPDPRLPRRDDADQRPIRPELQPRLASLPAHRFPLSLGIEEHYRAAEAERTAAEGRRRLREPVRAALARSRRAIEKLADEAARVPAAEDDRRRADLLKQNLHAVSRGARHAVLTEWTEDGAREVTVALDPALDPRENMERYYRRYRRIVESAARVSARQAEVRGRVDALLHLLAAIDGATVEELPRLEREARRLGAAPRPAPRPRSRRDEPLLPYRSFRSVTGVALLVGRNAEGNDALTVKIARGNDLWLHARGQSGAHVIARLDKGKAPDGETLLDGAQLAAHFSGARGEPQVEVVATRAKYVRKLKGAASGAVSYSQERSILLRVDRARIERLLASEEG